MAQPLSAPGRKAHCKSGEPAKAGQEQDQRQEERLRHGDGAITAAATMGFFAGDAVADLNLSVIVKSKRGALLYSK